MICSDCEANVIYTAAPFSGQGVSLYVTAGSTVQYREQWADSGDSLGVVSSCLKTARVDSAASPVTELSLSGLSDGTYAVSIRTFKDDVENESIDFQVVTISSGATSDTIDGTATLLNTKKRDGGIVRIRFAWAPAATGLQPELFTAIRTAGPTSPASVDYVPGSGYQVIEVDTPALSDASAYTYKIRATSGATTRDVLTGIIFTADATGPTAPTVTARSW